MAFSASLALCSQHIYLVPEPFLHPRRRPVPVSCHSPVPLAPVSVSVSKHFVFWMFRRNRATQHVCGLWLLASSPWGAVFRFLPVVGCTWASFLLRLSSISRMDLPQLVCGLVHGGVFGLFPPLVVGAELCRVHFIRRKTKVQLVPRDPPVRGAHSPGERGCCWSLSSLPPLERLPVFIWHLVLRHQEAGK